ncbi:unnamed protein product [Ixodes hexagonus]
MEIAVAPDPEYARLLLLQRYYLLKNGHEGSLALPIPRRWWVRPIWENRKQDSEFYTAMPLLMSGDREYFKKYYKTMPEKFDELHALVEEHLTRPHVVREPLPSRLRLAVTLRFLSSGMLLQDVALSFKIGISTASDIVHSTCRILWKVLQPLCREMPTPRKWEDVPEGFRRKWNFPHCVGAVDGTHVQIQAPQHSGSLCYNYKVLLPFAFRLMFLLCMPMFYYCDRGHAPSS